MDCIPSAAGFEKFWDCFYGNVRYHHQRRPEIYRMCYMCGEQCHIAPYLGKEVILSGEEYHPNTSVPPTEWASVKSPYEHIHNGMVYIITHARVVKDTVTSDDVTVEDMGLLNSYHMEYKGIFARSNNPLFCHCIECQRPYINVRMQHLNLSLCFRCGHACHKLASEKCGISGPYFHPGIPHACPCDNCACMRCLVNRTSYVLDITGRGCLTTVYENIERLVPHIATILAETTLYPNLPPNSVQRRALNSVFHSDPGVKGIIYDYNNVQESLVNRLKAIIHRKTICLTCGYSHMLHPGEKTCKQCMCYDCAVNRLDGWICCFMPVQRVRLYELCAAMNSVYRDPKYGSILKTIIESNS